MAYVSTPKLNRVLSATGYGEHRVVVSLLNGRIVVEHQNTLTGKIKDLLCEDVSSLQTTEDAHYDRLAAERAELADATLELESAASENLPPEGLTETARLHWVMEMFRPEGKTIT